MLSLDEKTYHAGMVKIHPEKNSSTFCLQLIVKIPKIT